MLRKGLISLFILFSLSPNVWFQASAYKGLFIATFPGKSHTNFYVAVIEALAASGHKITFISPFENNFRNENITEIAAKYNFFDKVYVNLFNTSTAGLFALGLRVFPEMCTSYLEDWRVVKALEEKYDYIMFSSFYTECFWDYTHRSKVPLIYVTPNVMMNPHASGMGIIEFLSVHPNKYGPLSYPLNFGGRVWSCLGDLFVSFVTNRISRRTERRSRELGLWSPDTPSASEIGKHISLAIINSIRPLENPVKATPPNIIYAGGIHIKRNNSLPKDIEDWLNGSGEAGFILFSLGTAVRHKELEKEKVNSILKVLGKLEQRVIWKWDAIEKEMLPPNVMIKSFLPQQDILAHPKIKLFITHGGIFSLQEATYHGVPVVGMPVFADQKSNIGDTEKEGWGEAVMWDKFTPENFASAIQNVLTNESIKRKVKERSMLMKDWPIDPAEEVVYWVNYVIRHKGAPHLQSPFVDMSWVKIYNMDVWAFIFVVIIASVGGSFYSLKLIFVFVKRKMIKEKKD